MPVLRSDDHVRIERIRARVDKDGNAHLIVCNLEQDQLSGAKRIKELQGNCGDHRAEEAIRKVNIAKSAIPAHRPSPHNFSREEIRHFLQTEQHTANRRTECNRNTGGRSSAQDFAPFPWELAVRSRSTGRETNSGYKRTYLHWSRTCQRNG